jgi:uncharacterized protein YecE (DUF72 family)
MRSDYARLQLSWKHYDGLMHGLRIGVAGFSYKDWEGIVYPPKNQRNGHPLKYVAKFLDLVEINTSFYGHIQARAGREWARLAGAVNPKFMFTAKLNKCFTHAPGGNAQPTSAATLAPKDEDEKLAKEGFDSIACESKLGAVLIQFPISFKNTEENRIYVEKLIRKFREYPLAIEVRHASWSAPEILAELATRGVSFCNIDQPLLGRALKPTEYATAKIGYVRLHGRNYDQWFEHEKAHDRYNYLYTEQQLAGWKQRIEHIAAKTETTFVVTNNHFEGKAAVNAVQLKRMLGMKNVTPPASLVEKYPVLAEKN